MNKTTNKLMNSDQASLDCPTYNYNGVKPDGEIQSREIKKSPSARIEKARQLYFDTKSSVSVEFPYWYTRKWEESEGEIPIVRTDRPDLKLILLMLENSSHNW